MDALKHQQTSAPKFQFVTLFTHGMTDYKVTYTPTTDCRPHVITSSNMHLMSCTRKVQFMRI